MNPHVRILSVSVFLVAGAVHAQSVVTTYQYDTLSNRTTVTDLIRLADVRAIGFHPSVAPYGQRVNVFGRNFPPGTGTGITVTFNGVPATIIVVAPNVITVVVPDGATDGPLVVTLPGAGPFDLGTFRVKGVIITPGSGNLVQGHAVQFIAQVLGAADQTVTWQLIVPTSLSTQSLTLNPGTLSAAGLYTAPPTTDSSPAPVVYVRATSTALAGISSTIVLSLCGVATQQPQVTVLAPAPGPVGGLAANTTVAYPPMLLLAPSEGLVGGLVRNTTVGYPPVEICGPPCGLPDDPCNPVVCP